MESTIKFPVFGSYKFELFLKCKLSSYISRTKYYMLQSIESHSIYYEQVFICLQQSNFGYIFGSILMKIIGFTTISSIWFWLNDLLTRDQQYQLHLLFDHSRCTCGFFRWSLVTLTWACIVVSTMTFFLPYFLLSMYNTKITFFSSWKT